MVSSELRTYVGGSGDGSFDGTYVLMMDEVRATVRYYCAGTVERSAVFSLSSVV